MQSVADGRVGTQTSLVWLLQPHVTRLTILAHASLGTCSWISNRSGIGGERGSRAVCQFCFHASMASSTADPHTPYHTVLVVCCLQMTHALSFLQALKKVPGVNSSWHGDFIRQYHNIDISIAVQTPNGLMVPVVRDTYSKGLTDIGAAVKALAGKVCYLLSCPELCLLWTYFRFRQLLLYVQGMHYHADNCCFVCGERTIMLTYRFSCTKNALPGSVVTVPCVRGALPCVITTASYTWSAIP